MLPGALPERCDAMGTARRDVWCYGLRLTVCTPDRGWVCGTHQDQLSIPRKRPEHMNASGKRINHLKNVLLCGDDPRRANTHFSDQPGEAGSMFSAART